MDKNMATMKQCAGATMIEALVSLFVLAIGLLGVLGMQAEGTMANQRGMFSTQAAFLAQDMADRIRVNDDPKSTADDGIYGGTDTAGSYPIGNCDTADCAQTALRDYDRGEWKQQLESLLPGGKGIVSWNSPVYTITVIWEERLGRSDQITDACAGVTVPAGSTCFQVEVRP